MLSFFSRHAIGVVLILGALRLLWPGDAPFVHDEPELIERALVQNATGEWTTHGLRGSRGVDYGPVPIVFYRFLLRISSNPIAWVILKTLLVTLLTGLAVFGFLRLFPAVPRWCAIVPFVSPYLWFFSRDLWDNSLNIPVSALLFVSVLLFVRAPRRRWFVACGGLSVCALLIHLMAMPIVIGSAALIVRFQYRWLVRNLGLVIFVMLMGLAVSSGYLLHLSGAHTMPAQPGLRFDSLLFGLLGARVFTALALEYYFGWGWFLSPGWTVLLAPAVFVSTLALAPTFWGLWKCVVRFREEPATDEGRLAWLVVVVVGLHVALMGLSQLVSHPHDYNAVWFAFYAAFCFGAAFLRAGWARAGAAVYLGAMVIVQVGVALLLHMRQGNRELRYGPTLANQIQVASQLDCYSGVPLVDNREHSQLRSLGVLRRFVDCPGPVKTATRLEIRHRRPGPSRDGEIELVAVP